MFNWQWDEIHLAERTEVRGWIAKMGNRWRIRFNPTGPPVEVDSIRPHDRDGAAKTGAFSNVGYDEISNGSFEMERPAEQSRLKLLDRVLVKRPRRVRDASLEPFAGTMGGSAITPMRPLTTLRSDPFDIHAPYAVTRPDVTKRVIKTDDGQCEIRLELEESDSVVRRVLRFTGGEERLLVFASLSEEVKGTGKMRYDTTALMENFVPLMNGSVPTRIRLMSKYGDNVIAFTEYTSTTPEEPEVSDFRMTLDAGIPVWGLKEGNRFVRSGYIDIDELTDEDVPPVPVAQPPSRAVAQPGGVAHDDDPQVAESRRWYGIAIFNVIVLAFLFALFACRRRSLRKKP